MSKQDALRDEITAKLLKNLEAGTMPWRKPWFAKHGAACNAVSNRHYKGCNVILLAIHQMTYNLELPLYATYNQWKGKGCQVKSRPVSAPAGGWGSPIIFYTMIEKKEKDENGKISKFPMMRSWTVFNVDQVEGKYADELRAKWNTPVAKGTAELHATAQHIVDASGAAITHGGERACYNPSADVINMPNMDRFKSTEHYYGTAFHELAHWTGCEKRLDRLDKFARFGSNAYAMEELVAELAGVFTVAAAGLPLVELENHASYLQNWISVLKTDNRAIFQASTAAQAASDYMLRAAGMLEEGQDQPAE